MTQQTSGFGATELSVAEMRETTGGEYSVMWLLGYVFQASINAGPLDPWHPGLK